MWYLVEWFLYYNVLSVIVVAMKKVTGIRLEDEELAFLKQLGSGNVSQAVRSLIAEKKKLLDGESDRVKTPEEMFFDSLLLPADPRLRETYCSYLELCVESGVLHASLDYLAPALMGRTGYDEGTIRKHFRKLASLKFVKSEGLLFRPTLRLKQERSISSLRRLIQEFADFLHTRGNYRDVAVDLWEDMNSSVI